MIPESKTAAVSRALQTALGSSEYESISELTAGLSSALIYKIVVGGKPYLLRVIMRNDAMADPTHYYGCMKVAADAGLAPRIWYASSEDRISITDFVEAKPFPLAEARVLMPDVLKRLHALPRFPSRINYLDFVDRNIRKLQASKTLPDSLTEEVFLQYERIHAIYPRNDQDLVSCHNDLKPDNVLFDGSRVWLVDWEAAFPNDRYTELSVVANFILRSDQDEEDYLKRYFGEDLTEYHRARFFLMRQVMHMIYLSFFMSLCAADGKPVDLNVPKPEFREFHDRLWKGELHLLDKNVQLQYALVHLDQVKYNLRLKRFEESLQTVSNHQ